MQLLTSCHTSFFYFAVWVTLWLNHDQHGAWAPWLLLRTVGVCRNCSRNRAPPLAQHRLCRLQHHYSHHLHERLVDGVCVAQHWHLPVWAVQISTGVAAWPAGITPAPSGSGFYPLCLTVCCVRRGEGQNNRVQKKFDDELIGKCVRGGAHGAQAKEKKHVVSRARYWLIN